MTATAETPDSLIAPVLDGRPVIAVVTLSDWRQGPPVARALAAGNIGVEITLRTSCGLEALRAAAAEVPEAMIGAGTCLTVADLEASRAAGAKFAVSPGLARPLLAAGKTLRLPYMAGVATASEVMAGMEEGYSTFKFFPAAPAGGVDYLKGLAGPLPQARFCPTGGVSLANAPSFLALRSVVCVGGSWLAPDDAVRDGDWARIERLAREARAALGQVQPAR